MRLIDADILYEGLKVDEELARDRVIDTPNSFPDGTLNPSAIRYTAQLSERTRFKEIVYDAPTIDAVPVRHGKWKLIRMEDNGDGFYTCSNCDRGDIHSPLVNVPYCWYCGARMDEE